ncbi:MAG: aminotransferase class IV [bacterium]
MQNKYIIKNKILESNDSAGISVFNKALFFDFCVYSNIKVVQGKMFLPDLEIEKLIESAKAIGIDCPYDLLEIIEMARLLILKNDLRDALIRILLIGQQKDSPAEIYLFAVGLTFYPNKFYKHGVKLATYNGERFFPTAKTKNLLMSYVAYNHASSKGAIDALLIDRDNNIREGTRCSFYAIKGDSLIIPPKEMVLEGITKKIIIEIANKIMDVKEQPIPLMEISAYDEFFISASTMNIMPVAQIDDIVIGPGVGKKTFELMKLYKEHTVKLHQSL